jgi:hypothetical protein
MENKKPERKHVVKIEIQADDWLSVIGALKSILFDFQTTCRDGVVNSVSGGYSHGYTVNARVNKFQTHDKCFEENDAFLAQGKRDGH